MHGKIDTVRVTKPDEIKRTILSPDCAVEGTTRATTTLVPRARAVQLVVFGVAALHRFWSPVVERRIPRPGFG
jgi:hypothetical protein